MPRLRLIPHWLRRGLEAGIFTAAVAVGTLAGLGLSGTLGGRAAFPAGPIGPLLLALPVLAVGVLAVAYPVALAATRVDAICGAITGVLVAADLTTLLVGDRVLLTSIGREVPLGILTAILALAPAAVGVVVGQLTPLGFGRQAGFRTTLAAVLAAVVVLVLAGRLG